MHNRNSRFRFITPNGTPPFAREGNDDKDGIINDPDKKNTDAPDSSDDDLKNVDDSQGGYGGGSGFSKDRT